MIDYDKVNWPSVHDYLLDIESAHTKKEFFTRAASGIDRLIPIDVAVGLHDDSGRMVFGNGLSDANHRAFNDYYRFRIPFIPDAQRIMEISLSLADDNHCVTIKWRDYRDTEFVTDFARPQGWAHNLVCVLPEFNLALSLLRSSLVSKFSETDCVTLAVISPHLSNLYSCFKKLERSAMFTICEQEVRERFPLVSKREAEIAVLLCRGLTASEIASKLFLSVRTVESHIGHLYMKLDVWTKREAISRLTS